jgi:hypothetical protein
MEIDALESVSRSMTAAEIEPKERRRSHLDEDRWRLGAQAFLFLRHDPEFRLLH